MGLQRPQSGYPTINSDWELISFIWLHALWGHFPIWKIVDPVVVRLQPPVQVDTAPSFIPCKPGKAFPLPPYWQGSKYTMDGGGALGLGEDSLCELWTSWMSLSLQTTVGNKTVYWAVSIIYFCCVLSLPPCQSVRLLPVSLLLSSLISLILIYVLLSLPLAENIQTNFVSSPWSRQALSSLVFGACHVFVCGTHNFSLLPL